ncbi:hydroxyacid dehydrogenase [Bosea sp. BK604]|uniref:NAD(P)-dependent oxidoreductase n=1 Tax=Bosea sp. BK604 TaxID=2512180 RepID=UPI0010F21F38|nr:hydroxyacid dehydrogenase [Bosea sp. BK604]TCR65496.1 D-3-phosphoglycerate dehydrogenase [Bosea sp. BK604]
MQRFRVLATSSLHPAAEAFLSERCDFAVSPDNSAQTLKREIAGADALIVRVRLPDDIFEHAPRLKVCIRHGVGLDFIPVEAATKKGIVVGNLVSANTQAVIEHAVGSVILLARDFHGLALDFARNGWPARDRHPSTELAGKTLGIVGCGRIGRGVAEALHAAFGMRVIGYNRSPIGEGVIAQAALDEVFAQADVVCLAIAATAETRGIVDARRLGLMKPGSFLVNVARGELIEDAALIAALESGGLAGAALDVFDPEPLPDEHPLRSAPRLFLTPHTAGGTEESLVRTGMQAAADVLDALSGRKPSNLVNPAIWPDHVARLGTSPPVPGLPGGFEQDG